MAIDQRSGARSRSRTIGARLVIGLLALLAVAALISLLDTNRGSVRMLDMLREPSVYLAAALAVVAQAGSGAGSRGDHPRHQYVAFVAL